MKDRDGSESENGSHFEGDFEESRRAAERAASGQERHHADQPLGGYGFGDHPLDTLHELESAAEQGAVEEGPEPRRKHGGGPTHRGRD